MLHPQQLADMVVGPTLRHLGLHSRVAVKLMVGTALAEGVVGSLQYLRQTVSGGGYGPARGIFQMEPATLQDHLAWLNKRSGLLLEKMEQLTAPWPAAPEDQLISNLTFAVAIGRVHYYRRPEPLPADSMEAIAAYWKQWWNTPAGAGTVGGFIKKAGAWLEQLRVA